MTIVSFILVFIVVLLAACLAYDSISKSVQAAYLDITGYRDASITLSVAAEDPAVALESGKQCLNRILICLGIRAAVLAILAILVVVALSALAARLS